MTRKLCQTVQDVIDLYSYEEVLEFFDLPITDVNQQGHNGDAMLHVACLRKHEDEVKSLLGGGADSNLRGNEGYTPLHYAVLSKDQDVVNLLLD